MLKIFKNQNGNSAVEYAIVIIIIMGALLSIQNYFKRGVQGRWQTAVDGVGDQYDPLQSTSDLTHTLSGTATTSVRSVDSPDGTETLRTDNQSLTETRSGSVTTIGP